MANWQGTLTANTGAPHRGFFWQVQRPAFGSVCRVSFWLLYISMTSMSGGRSLGHMMCLMHLILRGEGFVLPSLR